MHGEIRFAILLASFGELDSVYMYHVLPLFPVVGPVPLDPVAPESNVQSKSSMGS